MKNPVNIKDLLLEVLQSDDIAVYFDEQLNYVLVNQKACDQLNRVAEALIGKSIVDLYPGIVASKNHRNLLKALSGITIVNDIIEGRNGENFESTYVPVMIDGRVKGLVVKARKV